MADRYSKTRSKIECDLEGSRVGTLDDVRRYARDLGYKLTNGKGSHIKVYYGERYVCSIKGSHKRELTPEIYRGLLRQLLKGL